MIFLHIPWEATVWPHQLQRSPGLDGQRWKVEFSNTQNAMITSIIPLKHKSSNISKHALTLTTTRAVSTGKHHGLVRVQALGLLAGWQCARTLTHEGCCCQWLIVKLCGLATARAVSAGKHHGLVRVQALGLLAVNCRAPWSVHAAWTKPWRLSSYNYTTPISMMLTLKQPS